MPYNQAKPPSQPLDSLEPPKPPIGGASDDDIIDVFVDFNARRSAEFSQEMNETLQIRRGEGVVNFFFKNIQTLDNTGEF